MIVAMTVLSHSIMKAATPAEVADKCAATLAGSPSVTVDFTVVDSNGNEGASSLIVSGNKFRLTAPGMETWYDGATQWTYYEAESQLSISEPTAEELIECNPLALVSNWKKLFSAVSTGRKNEVRLDAKNKSTSLKSVLMTVNPATSLPSRMLVTFSNSRQATILIKNIRKGKTVPASTFRYDSKKYSPREVVDLR